MVQESCNQTVWLTSSHSDHENQVEQLYKRRCNSSLLVFVPIEDTNDRIGHAEAFV